eukprot:2572230-Ditylum_brightwellii.AAC.1
MAVIFFHHLQSAYLSRLCRQGSKKWSSYIFAICSQCILVDYVSKAAMTKIMPTLQKKFSIDKKFIKAFQQR